MVKVGGALLADAAATRAVLEQVEALLHLGIRVVLVHGGGPQASALSRALGGEPRFVAGRRVTDDAAFEAAVLTLNGDGQHRAARRLPRRSASPRSGSPASTPGWCGRAGGRR